MIEHCISVSNQEAKERARHEYMAECARITTENTAKLVGILAGEKGEPAYIGISLRDLLEKGNAPEETRTAEEIIAQVTKGLIKKEAAP